MDTAAQLTQIMAKQFDRRSELEDYVRNKAGLTPEVKPTYIIIGTDIELARLQLSTKTIFWGIRCANAVPTNTEATIAQAADASPPEVEAAPPRPERGPVRAFGLDGQNLQTPDGAVDPATVSVIAEQNIQDQPVI